jgi:hypothetical protein
MVKINGIEYQLSEKKGKKLKAYVNEKWVHFGQKGYEHFFDKTGLLPKDLNHKDEKRRELYLKRASKIKDKEGNLTANDKTSPNWFSINILW